jgi:hypothetical protein
MTSYEKWAIVVVVFWAGVCLETLRQISDTYRKRGMRLSAWDIAKNYFAQAWKRVLFLTTLSEIVVLGILWGMNNLVP